MHRPAYSQHTLALAKNQFRYASPNLRADRPVSLQTLDHAVRSDHRRQSGPYRIQSGTTVTPNTVRRQKAVRHTDHLPWACEVSFQTVHSVFLFFSRSNNPGKLLFARRTTPMAISDGVLIRPNSRWTAKGGTCFLRQRRFQSPQHKSS